MEQYNGWTNYPTWNAALWLGNDRGSYERCLELAREAKDEARPTVYLADCLQEEFGMDAFYDSTELATGMFTDILGWRWLTSIGCQLQSIT